uniref:DUF1492 domain-containing protein n=1 Tax=Streptococcus agalactiae TaxID=1311 RepID=UPI001F5491B9
DLKRNLFKIDVRAQKDEEKVFMRTACTAQQLLCLAKERDKRLAMITSLQDEKQIAVIKARYVDDLSWDEIPDKVGCSRNTVFKLHRDALEVLDEQEERHA